MNYRKLMVCAPWIIALLYFALPDLQGTDFYPLYQGGRSLLEGKDPYSEVVQRYLEESWVIASTHKVAPVIAYPLPLLIMVTPLALLDLQLAVYFWLILNITVLLLAGTMLKNKGRDPLLLLLYYPLFHALTIKTSSAIFLALILIVMHSDTRNRPWTLAFLTSLLTLKPQIGCIFWIYFALHSFCSDRSHSWRIISCTLALWVLPLLYDVDWIWKWLTAVQAYSERASMHWMLEEGLLLMPLALLTGLTPFVAVLQTFLFPLNDLYCVLPLLLVWLSIKKEWLRYGAVVSWGALLLDHPNSSTSILYFCYLPLFAALLAYIFLSKRRSVTH